jgi:hypothetical protein
MTAVVATQRTRLPARAVRKPAEPFTESAAFPSQPVRSVSELLDRIARDTRNWDCRGHVRAWFRGQADAGEPLIPSVLRTHTHAGRTYAYDELHMTTMFQLKSLAFSEGQGTPETSRLDQWLFLMQHHGLPTRLLDWTENALAACFFAAEAAAAGERAAGSYRDPEHMAIWMLHPIRLNQLAMGLDDFPNTWVPGRPFENFRLAFDVGRRRKGGVRLQSRRNVAHSPTSLPLAVQPSNVATRVAVQRSCFTVHGTDPRALETLLSTRRAGTRLLRKYVIRRSTAAALLNELEGMGVSDSALYPDFDGLARELRRRFLLEQESKRPGRKGTRYSRSRDRVVSATSKQPNRTESGT